MGTGMGIVIFCILFTFTVAYNIWKGNLPKLNLSKLKVPDFMKKVPDFAKTWKFWGWALGIAAAILVFVFVPRLYSALHEEAVSERLAMREHSRALIAECKMKEEATAVRYTKIARTNAPTVDTIPPGWDLEKWTDEDRVWRTVTRTQRGVGSDLVEINRPVPGVDSIQIAFRLYKMIC